LNNTAPQLKRTRLPKKVRMKESLKQPYNLSAERCRRSFFHFLQEFWEQVSNDEFKPNWHIELLCNELTELAEQVSKHQPKKHDLIVNIPPGTTKTITCSIMFPVWCWIRWHWMRFITASYSGALSLESAEYSRDLIRSEKFSNYFPYLQIKQDKDTKSNFRVQKSLPNGVVQLGGNRYSTSVGGTLTGFHGHILLVDDPLDPNRAVSEVELNNANRWMEQTLSTRKVDKAISPTVLIMQRLHQDDPSGHMLAKKKENVRHISLPGEIRNYKKEVKPKELIKKYKDDLLDPNRMNWTVMQDMEADLGQYGYAGQVGQRPTPPGGGMFKVDHFQVIDTLPSEVNWMNMVRYWDKAGTQDGGTYTVGCKMLRLKNDRYIIIDIKRGQWATEEREAIIKQTAQADGNSVMVYMEQEPGSGGKDSIDFSIRNLAGYSVYADRPTGDKVFRADPYSVQVNNGNIMLLRADWNYEFIEEHRNFPFSTYKDQVDAASGGFSRLAHKRIAGPVLRSRSR
jgi:predicted phage terminase large subunit-like protein